MDGKRLIHSLRLENFLSYGPQGMQIELEPLNIVIGPNASGKSNLIQAIELLRASPINITLPIIQGGGVDEWLFKGGREAPTAELQVVIDYPNELEKLIHTVSFVSRGQHFQIVDETIQGSKFFGKLNLPVETDYYNYRRGQPVIATQFHFLDESGVVIADERENKSLSNIKIDLSILSQRNDPDSYPALAYLSEAYRAIKIYRGFNLDGPNSLRRAQQPDLPNDFLEEDGRNLSLILNELQHLGVMGKIVEKLRVVYEDVVDITVRVAGGTVQTFLHERGQRRPIPAARLSDGTLRYLCLLAILYHPTPPPLICLEEPEAGLHPDLISGLAEMLKEASQRTQLIVTTHSDLLVSSFTGMPEAVVVSERTPEGTTLKRLKANELQEWLKGYSLGEVWLKGGFGGTRW